MNKLEIWDEPQTPNQIMDEAKRHSKWGSKSSTNDIINQETIDNFFGKDIIQVNDDYCGESCQIES